MGKWRCDKPECDYSQDFYRIEEYREMALTHATDHVFDSHPDLLGLDVFLDYYYSE